MKSSKTKIKSLSYKTSTIIMICVISLCLVFAVFLYFNAFKMSGDIDTLNEEIRVMEETLFEQSGSNAVSTERYELHSALYVRLEQATIRQFVLISFTILFTALLLFFLIYMSTEFKRRYKKLQDSCEELKIQNANLEAERDKASNESGAKADFLAHISSDFRTPLTGIVGMTEIAKHHMDNPIRLADCFAKIDNATNHLISLVNNVMDMNKIEQGQLEIKRSTMNMSAFVDSCISIIVPELVAENIEFIKEIEVFDHPYVSGDEVHLRQAVLNILGNAAKFTPEGGKVFLRVRELDFDGYTVTYFIQIEDTGIGMRPNYLEYIWEPMSQGRMPEGNADYDGTGLGMSITKKFIELMGGEIKVSSEPDKGSVFTITVPMPIDLPTVLENKGNESRLSGARVLLVDDNDVNRDVAIELLEEEGAQVSPAENGQVAVSMFAASPTNFYDAILMDITMPVMDGFKACELIRALDRADASTVPIIAMTANSFERDIRRSREAGMNAHLSKPVDIATLTKTLLGLIKKRNDNLSEKLEEALTLANTDSLTGVKNKTAYDTICRQLNDEIYAGKNPKFAIVVCDVNGLKTANDTLGHETGDKLIIDACKAICKIFKHSPVFRVGGDEFAVVLRNEDFEDREALIKDIHGRMEQIAKDSVRKSSEITFASGYSCFEEGIDENVLDVFKRADADMYRNKKKIKEWMKD